MENVAAMIVTVHQARQDSVVDVSQACPPRSVIKLIPAVSAIQDPGLPLCSRSSSISLMSFRNRRLENSVNLSIPSRSPSFRRSSLASANAWMSCCLERFTSCGVWMLEPSVIKRTNICSVIRSVTTSPSMRSVVPDLMSCVSVMLPSLAKTIETPSGFA